MNTHLISSFNFKITRENHSLCKTLRPWGYLWDLLWSNISNCQNYKMYEVKIYNTVFSYFFCFFFQPEPFTEATLDTLSKSQHANQNHKEVDAMWPETESLLRRFYNPFNVRLAEMLNGKDFVWSPGWIGYECMNLCITYNNLPLTTNVLSATLVTYSSGLWSYSQSVLLDG